MYEVTKKHWKKNIFNHEQLGFTLIKDKMREDHLRWYRYMLKRPPNAVVKKDEIINVNGTRKDRGRPKKTLIETINKYLSTLNVTKHMIFYTS